MESLVGYESDAETPDCASNQPSQADSEAPKDIDTNYENVAMDESDQEMNNNVEEYYSADAEEGVRPEDAPLVFRTITEPRTNVRTSVERNSSDMEVDDSDLEDNFDEVPVCEVFSSADEEKTPPVPVTEPLPPELPKGNMDNPKEKDEQGQKRSRNASDTRSSRDFLRRRKRSRSLDSSQDEEDRSPTSSGRKLSKHLPYSRSRNRKRSESSKQEERSDRREPKKEPNWPPQAMQHSSRNRPKPSTMPLLKKKLIWKTKCESNNATWDATVFKNDMDGKVAEKFKRLMGIKAATQPKEETEEKVDVLGKQEEMFSNMEAQYHQARTHTHTQRGCGLGYPNIPMRQSIPKNS